ncbi:MAG: OprO/OprP family phosphate-selective porin, partial [Acidobacteriota bacterium]
GPDGFALESADGAFRLRLRALVQTDGRFFFDDRRQPIADTFVLRRARPIFEGTLFRIVEFRLMPDFGGGTTVLQDAYLDLKFSPAFRLRAGKAKVPVGLEALLEDKDLPFVERGLPSNLAPVRDVGVQLAGEPWAGRLVYAAGVFNGTPDGASGDLDTEDAKDFAARVFWRPFQRPAGEAPPRLGLGIGLGGSLGSQKGTVGAPGLPTYRTPGQQTVFAYRGDASASGTTLADGNRRRLAPQGFLYSGPWRLFAEWSQSSHEVRRGASRATLTHVAWQVVGSWALTGEALSERGVSPRRPFDPAGSGRGAVVVSLRYGELALDRDAFPLFADPAKAVRHATNLGASVAWLLNRGVKLMLDYQHTGFSGGSRQTERALLTRFQIAF